jgi:hypothetical protein
MLLSDLTEVLIWHFGEVSHILHQVGSVPHSQILYNHLAANVACRVFLIYSLQQKMPVATSVYQ